MSIIEARAKAGFSGWQVRSEDTAGSTVEVRIYDVIGSFWGVTADEIAEKLAEFPNAKQINVRANSPGGDAFDGLAIMNLLKQHPANVTGYVDGYAASACTIALMGCNEIHMGVGSMWMVHEPWTFAIGNAGDLRDTADFLDKVNDSVVGLYTTRTKQSRAVIAQMVADETWLNAEETVEEGFADTVLNGEAEDSDANNATARKANNSMDPGDVIAALFAFAKGVTEEQEAPAATTRASVNALLSGVSAPQARPLNGDVQPTPANQSPADCGSEPKPKEGIDMDAQKQIEALEKRVNSLSEQVTDVSAEADKLRTENKAVAEANAELKSQLGESEKALSSAREQLKASNDKAAELNKKITEHEVSALVGKKITAEEKDRFVRLALKDRDLFQEMVDGRPDMKLSDRVVPTEQNPNDQRPAEGSPEAKELADVIDAVDVSAA